MAKKRKKPQKKKKEPQKRCAKCGTPIKPWMTHCYKCHHQEKGDYNAKKLSKIHGGAK